jgi:Ca-activated chloride channel family protein
MNVLIQRSSSLLVVAILTACVAQREPAPEPSQQTETVANAQTAVPLPEAVLKPELAKNSVADAGARDEMYPSMEYDAPVPVQASQRVAAPALGTVCCVQPPVINTEKYQHLDNNPVHLAAEEPVSTFSIDVDTGSYTNVRRYLTAGQLPPQDAVRVEEMINYFDYQYPAPATRAKPFEVSTQLATAPWNANALLLKIGIKGFDVANTERPPANLVFLIDVSGSMEDPDKLPLLKQAFHLLTEQLTARDCVSMVVYAGNSGVVLPPTPGDHKREILAALDRLEAGGSTNGADGIQRAYQLARANFIKNGINRVVLATDGDFNVGVVNFEALVDMAERERASGVALTTLGFGTGNYNDQLMERLADAGNGNYAYVDNEAEARKVLVSQLSGTLFTIAKDVKIQVEFNPSQVREYRLIGYENRMLAREDFNNDKVDAGEIGAGHRVTALYEIIPAGAQGRIDPLRYGAERVEKNHSAELANVRLRYKQPDGDVSQLLEYPVLRNSQLATAQVPADFKFAASVAAFGQLLRGGQFTGKFGYQDVVALAQQGRGADRDGYRQEFISLVERAQALSPGVEQLGSR